MYCSSKKPFIPTSLWMKGLKTTPSLFSIYGRHSQTNDCMKSNYCSVFALLGRITQRSHRSRSAGSRVRTSTVEIRAPRETSRPML